MLVGNTPQKLLLNVTRHNRKKVVSVNEFYDLIGGDPRTYYRWVKQYITQHPAGMPQEGQDYIIISKKQVGRGRQRKEILITIDFLKQLCFDIKTHKCRDIRAWANTTHL